MLNVYFEIPEIAVCIGKWSYQSIQIRKDKFTVTSNFTQNVKLLATPNLSCLTWIVYFYQFENRRRNKKNHKFAMMAPLYPSYLSGPYCNCIDIPTVTMRGHNFHSIIMSFYDSFNNITSMSVFLHLKLTNLLIELTYHH